MSNIDQAKLQAKAQLEAHRLAAERVEAQLKALELAKNLSDITLNEDELALMFWNIAVAGGFNVGVIADELATHVQIELEAEEMEREAA